MTRLIILDADPTSQAAKPGGKRDADFCHSWLMSLKLAGYDVAVPGIARYEVRREIFRSGARGSLSRLDFLHPGLIFLPITEEIMDIASELWAHVRKVGMPTASDEGLDGDAILAATAIVAAQVADEVIIATMQRRASGPVPGRRGGRMVDDRLRGKAWRPISLSPTLKRGQRRPVSPGPLTNALLHAIDQYGNHQALGRASGVLPESISVFPVPPLWPATGCNPKDRLRSRA